jgi:uncharacterized OB-fold protein
MDSRISKRPPTGNFTLVSDVWTEPFWAAAREHRLVAPACADCGHFRMPPTPFCPVCQSQRIDWVTLSGRGSIYSYTIVERAIIPGMEEFLPYVPAVISFVDAGSARLISNIVDAPLKDLAVGRAVEVVWDDIEEDISLPRFVLADQEPRR